MRSASKSVGADVPETLKAMYANVQALKGDSGLPSPINMRQKVIEDALTSERADTFTALEA